MAWPRRTRHRRSSYRAIYPVQTVYTPPVPRGESEPAPVVPNPKSMYDVFPTWGEYLEVAEEATKCADNTDRSFWRGTKTYAEALDLAKHGWPGGMAQVRAIAMPLVDRVASTVASHSAWGWNVTGSNYDMGEYMTGTPEVWLSPTFEEQKPLVRIGIDLTTSGGIDQKILTMRGCAVVALTLALQTAGYIVEVSGLVGIRPDNTRDYWSKVTLTDPDGGALDTDRLVYGLAHPSASRYLSYTVGYYRTDAGKYDGDLGWANHAQPWTFDFYMAASFLTDCDWENLSAVSKWVQVQYDRLTTQRTEA